MVGYGVQLRCPPGWFKSNAGLQPKNLNLELLPMKLIYCLIAALLGITLSNVKFLEKVDGKTVSILGWSIALFLARGGK